ncbi:tyrosine-type recombinase/integrase [Anaerosolibacter sp.]|uniref:tyrosine-type recombinase/integrase n=1 Tax=Anaerosolibacter sp. TaxID=1872527 RepID=UPI0039EF8A37
MNKDNEKLLKRYELICRNKGLTVESIKAFCKSDLPLFMRFIDDKPLVEVNHIDVEDFFDYCINERSNGDQAISRKFAALNSFFRTMIKKDYLDMKNPLDKLDKIKVRKKVRGHLTEEEVHRLMDYIENKKDYRGAALVALFYSSGCRLSEIWQQDRNSLDFEKRQFKVIGKGEKERMVIFSEDAKQKIFRYLDSRKDDHNALFVSRGNRRYSKKSIQDYVKKTSRAAGIEKNMHPHIFRHSIAMNLLAKGYPLEYIQLLLGHENISTTQVYAHGNIQDIQSKIDEFHKS